MIFEYFFNIIEHKMFEDEQSSDIRSFHQSLKYKIIDGDKVSIEMRVSGDMVAELSGKRCTFMTR